MRLAFPADIGRKPALLAHGSWQHLHASERYTQTLLALKILQTLLALKTLQTLLALKTLQTLQTLLVLKTLQTLLVLKTLQTILAMEIDITFQLSQNITTSFMNLIVTHIFFFLNIFQDCIQPFGHEMIELWPTLFLQTLHVHSPESSTCPLLTQNLLTFIFPMFTLKPFTTRAFRL